MGASSSSSFSLTSLLASISGVFAAYHIPIPWMGNPLASEGPGPYRVEFHASHSLYEPLNQPRTGGTLILFWHGGGWTTGTSGNEFYVGCASMGRAIATYLGGGQRVALINYPKAKLETSSIVILFTALAAFAFSLAWILSFIIFAPRFWYSLALLCYCFFGWLLWVRQVATSGTVPVTAAEQLDISIQTARELVERYNPDHLVISGHSAGGHFAALIGLRTKTLFPSRVNSDNHRRSPPHKISVVGISGVYDVAALWNQSQWPMNWFLNKFCLEPAFPPVSSSSDGPLWRMIGLSPIHHPLDQAVALGLDERCEFTLVSARYDNELLLKQAQEFAQKLREHSGKVRHVCDVGVGHGLGLLQSQALLDLLMRIAK